VGFAVKCDDGGMRAAEVVTAALIARFAALSDGDGGALERFVRPGMHNWNGIAVGSLRPTELVVPAH